MKKTILLTVLIFLTGCNESQQKRRAFNIQDLKLGMQKFEVQGICNGSLEFVASEAIPDSNGCSRTVYRMWPNEVKNLFGARMPYGSSAAYMWAGNKEIRPYLLTFIERPPLTKADVVKLATDVNITDPNDFKIIVGTLDGYRPAQLVSISQDTRTIELQAIQQQQQLQNLQLQNQQLMNQSPPNGLIEIKPNAYGLGVHSDQYGRPVKISPYP